MNQITRGSRTILADLKITCCQCGKRASDEMPLMQMRFGRIGFYVHADCIARLALMLMRHEERTRAQHLRLRDLGLL